MEKALPSVEMHFPEGAETQPVYANLREHITLLRIVGQPERIRTNNHQGC